MEKKEKIPFFLFFMSFTHFFLRFYCKLFAQNQKNVYFCRDSYSFTKLFNNKNFMPIAKHYLN